MMGQGIPGASIRAALALAAAGWLGACGGPDEAPPAPAARTQVLVSGAGISGANGLHFAPDGRLFVASVIGSELVVIDPDSGAVLERLTAADGVVGPDDVAFAPDGAFFWTSILTGEVSGFSAARERVVAGNVGPGVNPITFSGDGRMFVAQCFFGDRVFELDPTGHGEPRLIADDLGPGCGLNGMDWGGDNRLYGPRWFRGEVVSIDVDSGERRVEAEGFAVPAAVKFDSQGRLHVLDTGRGEVVRVQGDSRKVVATLVPGLDNLAFDAADRLFVSSFTDGFVVRVEADGGTTELSPGGMVHPGGVAAWTGSDGRARVAVGDLHALRIYDGANGEELSTHRNLVGVGEMGGVISVAVDGANLILTAFTDSDVRIWDPVAGKMVARYPDLAQPVNAVRYGDLVAVAEHGAGRVVGLGGAAVTVFASDLPAPTGLATDGNRLFVSDRITGEIRHIATAGQPVEPRVVVSGLAAPEGLALWKDNLVVVEGESGRVLQVSPDGSVALLAVVAPGTPPASQTQPPALILNGVAVLDDVLFVTGETSRVLYRVDLGAPGPSVQ